MFSNTHRISKMYTITLHTHRLTLVIVMHRHIATSTTHTNHHTAHNTHPNKYTPPQPNTPQLVFHSLLSSYSPHYGFHALRSFKILATCLALYLVRCTAALTLAE